MHKSINTITQSYLNTAQNKENLIKNVQNKIKINVDKVKFSPISIEKKNITNIDKLLLSESKNSKSKLETQIVNSYSRSIKKKHEITANKTCQENKIISVIVPIEKNKSRNNKDNLNKNVYLTDKNNSIKSLSFENTLKDSIQNTIKNETQNDKKDKIVKNIHKFSPKYNKNKVKDKEINPIIVQSIFNLYLVKSPDIFKKIEVNTKTFNLKEKLTLKNILTKNIQINKKAFNMPNNKITNISSYVSNSNIYFKKIDLVGKSKLTIK